MMTEMRALRTTHVMWILENVKALSSVVLPVQNVTTVNAWMVLVAIFHTTTVLCVMMMIVALWMTPVRWEFVAVFPSTVLRFQANAQLASVIAPSVALLRTWKITHAAISALTHVWEFSTARVVSAQDLDHFHVLIAQIHALNSSAIPISGAWKLPWKIKHVMMVTIVPLEMCVIQKVAAHREVFGLIAMIKTTARMISVLHWVAVFMFPSLIVNSVTPPKIALFKPVNRSTVFEERVVMSQNLQDSRAQIMMFATVTKSVLEMASAFRLDHLCATMVTLAPTTHAIP